MPEAELRHVRLPAGLTGIEAGPRDSPLRPVLMLHGMMGGAWQFAWLQRALAAAGRISLAINYRGHHDSAPVARLGRVSVADYLRDALAAAAHVRTTPVIVGQSMGGLIGQLAAARGAAAALVLTCSLPPGGIRWRSAQGPRMLLRNLAPVLGGRPLTPDREELEDLILGELAPAERERLFARQVPESSRAAAEIALGLVRVQARHVSCPVLAVTGGRDRLVLPSVGEAIARRYRAEHLLLPGAGHYAIVGEPGCGQLAGRIAEWIAERELVSTNLRRGTPGATRPSPAR